MEPLTTTSAVGRQTSLLSVLRRRWPIILAAMVLVPLTAALLAGLRSAPYTARVTLAVAPTPYDEALLGKDQPQLSSSLPMTPSTIDTVVRRIAPDLNRDPDKLSKTLTLTAEAENAGVAIEATDPTRSGAAKIANSFARAYLAFVATRQRTQVGSALRLIEAQLPAAEASEDRRQLRDLRRKQVRLRALEAVAADGVELVSTATVPQESSPVVRNAVLGLILGGLLGFFSALLAERLDGRLRTREEVEQLVWPILGTIDLSDDERRREARNVLARLRNYRRDAPPRTVSVVPVGTGPGVGVAIAADLAGAAAAAGLQALVVEADLRGTGTGTGLRQAVLGELALDRAVTPLVTAGDGVDLLPGGDGDSSAMAVLEHPRFSELLAEAGARYDMVVLALPPLDDVADALTLSGTVDAVVVAATLGRTTSVQLTRAKNELAETGATLAGAVLLTPRADHTVARSTTPSDPGSDRRDAVVPT